MKLIYLAGIVASVFVSGCFHGRITASADVKGAGEKIRTQFRYKIVCEEKDQYGIPKYSMFHNYQPDVFSDDGLPVTLKVSNVLSKNEGELLGDKLQMITLGLIPSSQTKHIHNRCTISMAKKEVASFDVCMKTDEAMTTPLPTGISLLMFSGDGETCYASGKTFRCHSYDMTSQYVASGKIENEVIAYGIAASLKQAEDDGIINEKNGGGVLSEQGLSDFAAVLNTILKDDAVRRGRSVNDGGDAAPLEIVRFDVEAGKNFAYIFSIGRRGRKAAVSDYNVIRNGFRSAIRSHYSLLHPEINPRSLVIDFTEYKLQDGLVIGRVAVLEIVPESLKYDSIRRSGVVRVRIRDGQFEDARRWIRRNLAELANRSNINLSGDSIPRNGRFFSEREEMKDGILEVSFRTE